jgi:O-antigen/teichoic acid export membrane protein
LTGAVITVLINILFIPVYGYMASAWAHVASYGSMIVVSFIMAEKRYKVNYNMKQYIPYFAMAIGMVLFGKYFRYTGIIMELVVNTILILLFIAYAQYKDKLITAFLNKE